MRGKEVFRGVKRKRRGHGGLKQKMMGTGIHVELYVVNSCDVDRGEKNGKGGDGPEGGNIICGGRGRRPPWTDE